MKVCVINPPWETDKGYGARSNCRWPHVETTRFTHFPIYLGYTVALLEQGGIETCVLDCATDSLDSDGMMKTLEQEQPDLCLLEVSTPTIFQDLANGQRIKQELGSKVILMGAHATVFDQQLLRDNSWLDGIIRGEFEQTALEICLKPWSEVLSFTFRSGTEVIKNPERTEFLDLDELPYPAWDKFDLSSYDWALLPSPAMLTIATRGCPFQCSYCLWPQLMYGHKQRRRSPKGLCDEIEFMQKKYGIKGLRFDDDTFALHADYVREICHELINRGLNKTIQFSCFGHTSQPDEDLYRLMKEAGFIQIDFGIETGSSVVLDGLKKGTYIENARKTIAICRSLGIETYGTYMMGFPDETEDDIRQTLNLALELDTDFMQVSYVLPYPGTKIFTECEQRGYLAYGNDWERYDGTEPVIINKVPREKLMKLYKRFWSRYFLRPRYVIYFFRKSFQSFRDFRKAVSGVFYIFRKVLKIA